MTQDKKTILFVDDEESILEVASEYFLQKNYDVITAMNGHEALEVLDNRDVDCCFTDINMPDMDGIEAARRGRFDRAAISAWGNALASPSRRLA